MDIRISILVDGGFYRKRANCLAGKKTAQQRADELYNYCLKHLNDKYNNCYLYRIFYYDCPPLDKNIYNPITKQIENMHNSDIYTWTIEFFKALKKKRKIALRMGKRDSNKTYYSIKPDTVKKLFAKTIQIDNLTMKDIQLQAGQKGVDMRIGLDISSMAFKKQVDRIILISGDSDFVPAAKQARREGIDFILDPLGQNVNPDLMEHIDGMNSFYKSLQKEANRNYDNGSVENLIKNP